jgi:hypothetical protein
MFQWILRLFGSKSAATPAPASPKLLSASTTSFTVEPRLTSFDERKVLHAEQGLQGDHPLGGGPAPQQTEAIVVVSRG